MTVEGSAVEGTGYSDGTYAWDMDGDRWIPAGDILVLRGGQPQAGFDAITGAIAYAQSGDTLQLQADCDDPMTIEHKTLTLDLNGYSITFGSSVADRGIVTIGDGGDLTVIDSTVAGEPVVEGDGTVTYSTGEICATHSFNAIYVKTGGSFTLKSGTIRAKADSCYPIYIGNSDPVSGASASTVGAQNAEVNLEGGLVVQEGENGYGVVIYGPGTENNPQNTDPVLNISGGVIQSQRCAIMGQGAYQNTKINISGGTLTSKETAAIYHPQYGELNITGGTITGQSGIVVKGGRVMISGDSTQIRATGAAFTPTEAPGSGFYTTGDALYVEDNYEHDVNISVTGGRFYSANGKAVNRLFQSTSQISITGGLFSSDPSDYVAENYATLLSNQAGYTFQVSSAPKTEDVTPTTGDPLVDDSKLGNLDEDSRKTVAQVAASVSDNGELAAAANQAASQVTSAQKMQAQEAIRADNSGVTVNEDDSLYYYAQTYLDITPTDYTIEGADASLTLDITPKYRVVVSTQADADKIKIVNEIDTGEIANAVVLENSETELSNIQTMTIRICLPVEFYEELVYIQHKGYEYTAQADESGNITFTNPHGFSAFTISTASAAVAKIGDTSYTTLQDAVNDAASDDIITIIKGGNYTATANKTVTVQNNITGNITVMVNGNTKTLGQNESYTFTYSPSSGGPGVTSYSIQVSDMTNGQVLASKRIAQRGEEVTLTVTPAEGYELGALTVTDRNGETVTLNQQTDGTYTFVMPASNVTIRATFVETAPAEPTLPFTDAGSARLVL